MTVVVRGKINSDNEWIDQQVIFRAPADLYTPSGIALRLALDLRSRAGHLFFTIGRARRHAERAGSDRSRLGKIHRVNDDGTVPKDNPFVGTPGAVPTIWSYGHRNPEGLAWDPVTGTAVGVGARADRRRRNQHHRARPQLRVGRGDQGHAGRT